MDDALLSRVIDLLSDAVLDAEVEELVLSACQGSEELNTVVHGGSVETPTPNPEPIQPLGAYLREIRVSGFRGIGPTAVLPIKAGAGLTIVIGRNGSGKSSFAEALELLLTGSAERLERSQVFAKGWRNLHQREPCAIEADFVVEGESGVATARRSWQASDDMVGAGASTFQLPGRQRGSLDQLGWKRGLQTYRPFLSHGELEVFLGRPSELHDKIAAVLATDDLETATKRLADERKRTAGVVKEATSRLTDLRQGAGRLADERAAAFQDATKHNWDLDAVARLVDGSTSRHAETKPYDRLAELRAPDRSRVEALCADLRSAADGLEATAGSGADLARRTATVLRGALALHVAHGVEVCPVCERTPIDHEWRERAEASATELESAAAEATAVHRRATDAVGALRALASEVPLPESVPEVAGVDVAVARETLAEWHGLGSSESNPASMRAAAERLEILWLELDEAFGEVRAAAVRERDALDAQWRSLAIEIAAWIPAGWAAESVKATTARLTSAEKWLKSAHDTIRIERLEPLSEQTMTTWKALQHESNVSLRDLKLTGSATRRSVDFEMAVDDVGGAALGVMSQGEINALALSVFLPRATLPESPFRFLVIDDPVQAMDPARVAGLARVLSDVAADRQVVVFTHDDRLTAALRRLRLPANVLEVSRRDQSVVTVRETRSPSHQPLEDARALSLDEAVPAAEKALAIPILCREALEATLAERYRRSALQRGIEHRAVDDELANANTVTQVAALGLFGDRDRGADVLPYFNRLASRFADVMQALKRGAHDHHGGDLRLLVADTSDLVNRLEAER